MSIKQWARGIATAAKVFWKRNGSTIMIFGGSGAVVLGTFFACKSTLEVDKVLEKREQEKAKIEAAHTQKLDGYSEEEYKKDLVRVKALTAKDMAVLYWKAGLCTVGGLAMITCGRNMMKREITTAVAVSAAIKKSFDEYRARAKAKLGEEEEAKLYYGVEEREETEVTVEEDGTKIEQTVKRYFTPDGMELPSPYARVYDQTHPNWKPTVSQVEGYFIMLQNNLNDMFYMSLGKRGSAQFFLNDAYAYSEFEKSKAGQFVGWKVRTDGTTDNRIDLGVIDPKTKKLYPWQRQLYLEKNRIIVDYNVDGNIIHDVDLEDF